MLFLSGCSFFDCSNDSNIRFVPNTERAGVYWWAYWLTSDFSYLNFAARNGITEIYLSVPNLRHVNDDGTIPASVMRDVINPTREFIARASEKGITVYLLLGNNGSWLSRNSCEFHRRMNGLRAYQNLVYPHEQFAGLQLNVEPHQLRVLDGNGQYIHCPTLGRYLRYWDTEAEKPKLVQQLADFAIMAHDTYGNGNQDPLISIDWATTFWWNMHPVTVNGKTMPLSELLITLSNTIYVMGFRDSAARMVQVSGPIINFAQEKGRTIVLLASVFADDDGSQFVEEGRAFMYQQLNLVRGIAGCSSVHVAIHQIYTWRHWARCER